MGDTLKIPLVSSEIAGLWNSYMGDSLAVCVLKFFVNRVEDSETRSILQSTHIVASGLISISNDGLALAESLRIDLSTTYMRFLTEALDYSKDGSDIMINKKWFEQPPQAIKHENLVEV